MSIGIAREEIRRFLATKKPEVLCITGKWGVGKTYSWSRYLLEARAENSVAQTRYAYVSLFGQNSLDDLKYALFESTITLDQLESGPNFSSLEASLHFGEKWLRRLLPFANAAPLGRAILSGAGRTLFLAVRDQIVCIDDLERHGKGLEVKDVLGMLSFLKEQRRCKVVLLLNDEELKGDAQKDFETQLEKVVDTRLAFVPTPREAAEIGVSAGATFRDALIAHCVTLGITNIRVIKKLEDLCERLRDLLKDFDSGVLAQAMQTAALLGWSHYQPDLAPPLDFVTGYNSSYAGYRRLAGKKEEATAEEKAWSALLADYGFSSADEFDLVVLKGIQDGYFDRDALATAGAALNKQIEFRKKDNSFQEAWDLFHGSFQPNGDEVLDTMAVAFKKSVDTISPINLAGTVSLFKDLGRTEQAMELLKYYTDQRPESRSFYDLESSPFGSEVKDPDVRKVFHEKLAGFAEQPNPVEILKRIAADSSWNAEDLETLAGLTAKDFQELFEASGGSELRGIIKAALNFGSYGNASDQMKVIAAQATEALRAIGRQSPINARRIRIYGVAIEEKPPAEKAEA
jgi:hypothetical protein